MSSFSLVNNPSFEVVEYLPYTSVLSRVSTMSSTKLKNVSRCYIQQFGFPHTYVLFNNHSVITFLFQNIFFAVLIYLENIYQHTRGKLCYKRKRYMQKVEGIHLMNMNQINTFVDPQPTSAFDLLLDYLVTSHSLCKPDTCFVHVSQEFFALIHFYSKC